MLGKCKSESHETPLRTHRGGYYRKCANKNDKCRGRRGHLTWCSPWKTMRWLLQSIAHTAPRKLLPPVEGPHLYRSMSLGGVSREFRPHSSRAVLTRFLELSSRNHSHGHRHPSPPHPPDHKRLFHQCCPRVQFPCISSLCFSHGQESFFSVTGFYTGWHPTPSSKGW